MGILRSSDKDWELYGRSDPYYAVLTLEKYHRTNLTEEAREEFFRSGREHIDTVLQLVRRHVDSAFVITRALDFGCGVGRLLVPLAALAERVVGADVSEAMLHEAEQNCRERAVLNVDLVRSDDALSGLGDEQFDFIHSTLVFQHIPVRRGERIFRRLLTHLADDGVCVAHFAYAKDYGSSARNVAKKLAPVLKRYIPFTRILMNLARGRPIFAPQMQMNPYKLNRICLAIQKSGALGFHAEFTRRGGELGVLLLFRKPATQADARAP